MDALFYSMSGQSFSSQETQIARLQQELASGTKVPTAAADPAAYIGAQADCSTVQQLDTMNASQVHIRTNLGTGISALSQVSSALDHIQSIALQAINATTSSEDFLALGQQVNQGLQQIISLANTQTSNGNYIFSGTAKQTQPFIENASGSVSYVGNEGISSVEVSPNVTVNAALSGSVFTNALSGNGYASVSASSANTGSATILATAVGTASSATAFQHGNTPVTLSFSSSAGGKTIYTATMGSATIGSGPVNVANGASMTLTLKGVEFKLSGQPVTGDTFTIAPARPQSIFDLARKISAALSSPGTTPASRAQTRQTISNSLGGIAQYQDQIAGISAKAGVVLRAISDASISNTLASTNAKNNGNNLVSADEPKVITDLQNRTSALQAAMKVFAIASQLSIFNYL